MQASICHQVPQTFHSDLSNSSPESRCSRGAPADSAAERCSRGDGRPRPSEIPMLAWGTLQTLLRNDAHVGTAALGRRKSRCSGGAPCRICRGTMLTGGRPPSAVGNPDARVGHLQTLLRNDAHVGTAALGRRKSRCSGGAPCRICCGTMLTWGRPPSAVGNPDARVGHLQTLLRNDAHVGTAAL